MHRFNCTPSTLFIIKLEQETTIGHTDTSVMHKNVLCVYVSRISIQHICMNNQFVSPILIIFNLMVLLISFSDQLIYSIGWFVYSKLIIYFTSIVKSWQSVSPILYSEGSNLTPAHHYPDFRFKTYAPLAFRYFRELFGIKPDDYLVRRHLLSSVEQYTESVTEKARGFKAV